MGLRSAAYICQQVTNAVSYICDFHYGLQVINYLDDFAGCNTPDKASTEYDTLGQVLRIVVWKSRWNMLSLLLHLCFFYIY